MTVLRRFIADRRRSLGWSTLASAAVVALSAGFYPVIRDQPAFADLIESLPESLQSFVGTSGGASILSPAGYLHTRHFSTLLPIVLLSFGIGLGARAIAGAEEDGMLELMLAQPVTRARLAAERFGGLTLLVLGLAAASAALLIALAPVTGLLDGPSVLDLFEAHMVVAVMGLVHAWVAFGVGAATGRRTVAVAAGSALAVSGYLFNGLVGAAPSLRSLRFVTPWYWYLHDNAVQTGVRPVHGFWVATALAAAAAGGAMFVRRDLR